MKRLESRVRWVMFAAILLVAGTTAVLVLRPAPSTYSFIRQDHPIDMWGKGADKWAYYSIGEGTTEELASTVRSSLTQEGFSEDKSQKPWYRFVKGKVEVVVCNHNEFAVNNTLHEGNLVRVDPAETERRFKLAAHETHQWPCVLVKNGPGTTEPLLVFQAKKLIHGW